jgi:hypothetical protein
MAKSSFIFKSAMYTSPKRAVIALFTIVETPHLPRAAPSAAVDADVFCYKHDLVTQQMQVASVCVSDPMTLL